MPKEGYKKFGDPKFDQKRKPPDLYPPLSEDHIDTNAHILANERFKVLYELKDYYQIEGNDLAAWQILSMRLAEHCVPAMQFIETKKPKKWNFFTLSALYVLTQNTKEKFPDLNREAMFKLVIKEAQKTSLSVVINPNTSWSTLAGHYDRFIATKDFPVLLYPDRDKYPDSWKAYESFLLPKNREFFEMARKHPEMIEVWYLKSTEHIRKK